MIMLYNTLYCELFINGEQYCGIKRFLWSLLILLFFSLLNEIRDNSDRLETKTATNVSVHEWWSP